MNFHPPALQRRNQRLDFRCVATDRVPKQEAGGGRHDQQHKRAQLPRLVLLFVIQVKQCGDHIEQNEHLIQIRYRNMTDISPQQIRLIPAHQHAGKTHHHSGPAQFTANRTAEIRFRKQSAPVKQCRQIKQCAHPQNRGLARQQIFEQELLVRHVERATIQVDRNQTQTCQQRNQPAQWFPIPAKPCKGWRGQYQDDLFVIIHVRTESVQCE